MTEVTLRKANQLEKQALDAATKLSVPLTVKISVYEIKGLPTGLNAEEIEEKVRATRDKALRGAGQGVELIEAAFKIRSLISEANAATGINALLLEKAELDRTEQFLAPLASASEHHDAIGVETDTAVLVSKLSSLKTRLESGTTRGYGVEDHVQVTVFGAAENEMFEERLRKIRDRKTAINDDLMVKNMQGRVRLDPALIAVLKRHKISV